MLSRIPFPRKIPKAPKRASRWRSQAHCNHVRSYACSVLGCDGAPIEVAHVRNGSGAGMGQKPDDFRTISLCRACHAEQHKVGERTFWDGDDVEALIAEFNRTSPKAAEIARIMKEREGG